MTQNKTPQGVFQRLADTPACKRSNCICRMSACKGDILTHCRARYREHPSLSLTQEDGKGLLDCFTTVLWLFAAELEKELAEAPEGASNGG